MTEKNIDTSNICNSEKSSFPKFVLIQKSFFDAVNFCKQFKTELPDLSKDHALRTKIMADINSDKSCPSNVMWSRFTDIDNEGQFVDYFKQSALNNTFAIGQPNGYLSENCLMHDLITNTFFDWDCSFEACVVCQIPNDVTFTLRGSIPEIDEHDRKFTIQIADSLSLSRDYFFQSSLSQIRIGSSFDSQTWNLFIYEPYIPDPIAHYVLYSTLEFPIGTYDWYAKHIRKLF